MCIGVNVYVKMYTYRDMRGLLQCPEITTPTATRAYALAVMRPPQTAFFASAFNHRTWGCDVYEMGRELRSNFCLMLVPFGRCMQVHISILTCKADDVGHTDVRRQKYDSRLEILESIRDFTSKKC